MAEGRNEKGPKYKYYTFGRLYYNGAVPILTSDAQTAQQSASALLNFCSSNIMTIDSPCRYDDEQEWQIANYSVGSIGVEQYSANWQFREAVQLFGFG